jgi:hypothetical protein
VDGRPITKGELAALIEQEILKQLPAQSFLFAQPIEMRFNELLEGVRSDLSVKIIGHDYDVMEGLAAQVKAALDAVPGAGEVEFEAQGRAPVLEIVVDRDALRRYNLHAADVNLPSPPRWPANASAPFMKAAGATTSSSGCAATCAIGSRRFATCPCASASTACCR